MVWFEPERVIRGTQWAVEHPDWMLDIPEHNNDTYLLFDLGNPEACHWMSKYIGDMLEENSIDYYRQDFNMQPDIYWAANDEPGRTGMKRDTTHRRTILLLGLSAEPIPRTCS